MPALPAADPRTLVCLGVHWPYAGDDNENAAVQVCFRVAGGSEADWMQALSLFRIRPQNVPQDGYGPTNISRALAGSIFNLRPDTDYEIELALSDPDGGSITKTLRSRTRPVPKVPAGMNEVRVAPGRLAAALSTARAGDLLVLEIGTHRGTFQVRQKATADRPIVLRGASRDEVIIDTGCGQTALDVSSSACVYIENLTFQNGHEAIRCHQASGIVIRRCRTMGMDEPIHCTLLPASDFYIADNVLEGPCTWPAPAGVIQASTNLLAWVSLTNLSTAEATTSFVDFEAGACPQRFYRILLGP